MAIEDDDTLGPARAGGCHSCGAALSGGQRYCLECGGRRGALPPAIAAQIASLLRWDRGAGKPEDGDSAEEPEASPGFMPTPRVAAVAVMGMLALGVLLGSATSQIAQSAGLSSIILEVASPPPVTTSETASAPPEAAPEAASASAEASSVPLAPAPIEAPAAEAEPKPTPVEFPEEEMEEGLPEVKHVFMIVLGENGYEETFGPSSPAPYLAKTLPEQGELLSNYYGVANGDLANQIALLSGQGPTLEIAANCPNYGDVVPGTIATTTGQVEGNGCVYPAATPTLPGQLVAAGMKWKAYVEDIGNAAAAGQPTTCRHPALGTPDPSQVPLPGDAYQTWRNPFVYFHSLIDGAECAEDDVGLDQLAPDLKKETKTPTLSYIAPNACHDGGELPCEPGALAGPAEAEAFLQTVIPEITASPAYKEGGLIAIVSSQAPQLGEKADPSACCISPAYPNLPPTAPEAGAGPVKATGGGGQVGLLLISPFVEPGSVDEAGYYNHYTLLLTLEELFGLEKLGYAKEEALTPFDSTVFNAAAP